MQATLISIDTLPPNQVNCQRRNFLQRLPQVDHKTLLSHHHLFPLGLLQLFLPKLPAKLSAFLVHHIVISGAIPQVLSSHGRLTMLARLNWADLPQDQAIRQTSCSAHFRLHLRLPSSRGP